MKREKEISLLKMILQIFRRSYLKTEEIFEEKKKISSNLSMRIYWRNLSIWAIEESEENEEKLQKEEKRRERNAIL